MPIYTRDKNCTRTLRAEPSLDLGRKEGSAVFVFSFHWACLVSCLDTISYPISIECNVATDCRANLVIGHFYSFAECYIHWMPEVLPPWRPRVLSLSLRARKNLWHKGICSVDLPQVDHFHSRTRRVIKRAWKGLLDSLLCRVKLSKNKWFLCPNVSSSWVDHLPFVEAQSLLHHWVVQALFFVITLKKPTSKNKYEVGDNPDKTTANGDPKRLLYTFFIYNTLNLFDCRVQYVHRIAFSKLWRTSAPNTVIWPIYYFSNLITTFTIFLIRLSYCRRSITFKKNLFYHQLYSAKILPGKQIASQRIHVPQI